MADWSKPTITSNYITFVDEVKARDFDAITLQAQAIVNPPYQAVKLLRSPTKFQEWNGTYFQDVVLSLGGGGTGGADAATARSNLGLGSMAVQQSFGVDITGGIAGPITLRGNCVFTGGTFTFEPNNANSTVILRGGTGQYALHVTGNSTANGSSGVLITAGWSGGYALTVHRADFGDLGMVVSVPPNNGPMVCNIPSRLIIPFGADKWAAT